jgi:hypothetical protein
MAGFLADAKRGFFRVDHVSIRSGGGIEDPCSKPQGIFDRDEN